MTRTLIEASSKKRFATRFNVLENHRPTEESVLVFKETESSPNLIMVRYTRDEEGNLIQIGSLEEMTEERFREEHVPHSDWNRTSLKDYDLKHRPWRESSLLDKLESRD